MLLRKTLQLGISVTAIVMAQTPAIAQNAAGPIPEEAAETEAQGLEEILVTAQRREQSLQNVPVSVTAMTGEELERRQITDVETATTFVPNVSVGTAIGDPTDITLSIRGIQTPGTQLVQDSAVPLYIDGVYIGRTYGTNAAAIDLERIEVLRGPQGTLFGRNAVGGAVSMVTTRPTSEFEGYAEVEIGSFDARNATGVMNLPFGDAGGLRLVYAHRQYDPQATGPNGETFNSLNQEYFRATAAFDLGPDVKVVLSGDYFDVGGDQSLTRLRYFNPASPFNALLPTVGGRPTDRLTNYIEPDNDFYRDGTSEGVPDLDSKGFSLTGTVEARFGSANLRSITGYRKVDRDAPVDLDGTPYPLVQLHSYPAVVDQISQELQVFGDGLNDRLRYIVGLFFFEEDGFQEAHTAALRGIAPTFGITSYDATNTSYGPYAQLEYSVTPELTAIAGARYAYDKREIVYHDRAQAFATGVQTCSLGAQFRGPGVNRRGGPVDCNGPASTTFRYVPWTIGVNFEPNPDVLLYAKISNSFRSGGFSQATNILVPTHQIVDPEEVLSPEAGFKLDLLNRRLRVNGAVFYADYKNIQQQVRRVTPEGFTVATQVNAGAGHIFGGELEVSALLGDLNITAGLGVLKSEYDEGPFTGTPLLYAPEFSFSLGASYPIQTSAGELRLSGNYGYRSSQFHVSPMGTPAPRDTLRQDGYGILNAEARFAFKDLPITLTVWGRNLTEAEYYTRILDFTLTPLGAVIGFPGNPRTYGASLRFNF
jgi:iron complex outermembrane receptor protein